MKLLARMHRWHQTRSGMLAAMLVELAIAFVATSRAFATGSLWEYLVGLVFLVGALQNFVKIVRTLLRPPRRGAR